MSRGDVKNPATDDRTNSDRKQKQNRSGRGGHTAPENERTKRQRS